MVKAIVGANWGDEGKGKITDILAAKADVVVRFQGGSNAGHTIINDKGKFALHLLPSGVFFEHITNVIGNGVALDIRKFFKELNDLKERGVNPNILVSDRVQVMMPYHVMFDTYEEERLADKKFGSTKSGIAPFYSDKFKKIGFQLCELYEEEALFEKIKDVIKVKNVLLENLYHKPLLDAKEIFDELMAQREIIAPYVTDTFAFMQRAIKEGKNILLEGQLGALRDPDFGIYPYSTSSSTLAGFGSIGAGIPPHKITNVVTVVKAYSSCVGEGPFVAEIFGEEAEEMRKRGGDAGEYGATTGRPRRMGYLDLVATRYGCQAQGATEVALTVLDALGYLEEIPVCVAYELDGKRIDDFPNTTLQYKAKPIVVKLPGWKCDIRGISEFDKLPENAKNYVKFIEKEIGVPITMVSNGPKREEIMYR